LQNKTRITNKNQVTLLHHEKRIYNLTERKRAKVGVDGGGGTEALVMLPIASNRKPTNQT
jgi:hypothetical protein